MRLWDRWRPNEEDISVDADDKGLDYITWTACSELRMELRAILTLLGHDLLTDTTKKYPVVDNIDPQSALAQHGSVSAKRCDNLCLLIVYKYR